MKQLQKGKIRQSAGGALKTLFYLYILIQHNELIKQLHVALIISTYMLIVLYFVFLDETNAFLEVYSQENESFVETTLTYKCINQLEKTGLIVLTGKQGCGKTLTAVHIMKSKSYEGWVKRKLTSWEDLLAFDFNDKTLVYIDNIFDGYLYRHQLKKWWDTLCYFYFNFIKDTNSIRLLITAKDNVIENACAHIKANVPILKKYFFVEEESFPLTREEMLSIVTMQIKLAEEIKKHFKTNISRKRII